MVATASAAVEDVEDVEVEEVEDMEHMVEDMGSRSMQASQISV